MKYIVLGALLGLTSAVHHRFHPQGVTFIEESDEESLVQIQGDPHDQFHVYENYPAYMNGFGGYHTYMRDIPDRFETESDDILMRSMYNTYATEGRTDGVPDGNFWVT